MAEGGAFFIVIASFDYFSDFDFDFDNDFDGKKI
jgi:hypothetical protein